VNLQKVPGTLVKSCIFNSSCVLQNLVKCIENRRKFRKMQTQFFWIAGEKYYHFC
jgi:hypothetical protein